MDVDRAFALISAAARRGKTPNAYLFVGRLRGDAYALAVKTLSLFFDRHVEDRAHPDIHWLFPEKKSRIISVEAVHERLVGPALETPYLDGWKAGVVMGAECFNPASANAFLKTLNQEKRNIFVRRYWYMDSIAAISDRYGMTQSKVKSILFRIRNQLRSYLEKEGFEL